MPKDSGTLKYWTTKELDYVYRRYFLDGPFAISHKLGRTLHAVYDAYTKILLPERGEPMIQNPKKPDLVLGGDSPHPLWLKITDPHFDTSSRLRMTQEGRV